LWYVLSEIGDVDGGKIIEKQRVYTFLDGDVITRLDELASSQKVSQSELIRIAVEQYITNFARSDITTKESETPHLKEPIAGKDGYKQFNCMLCGFSVTAKTEEELLEHIRTCHMGFDWRWGFFPRRL